MDQVRWKLLSLRLRAVSKQKLTKSCAKLQMIRGRKKPTTTVPHCSSPSQRQNQRHLQQQPGCHSDQRASGERRQRKGRRPQSFSWTAWLHLVLPLVPLAGFAGARVAEATQAEDKLVVLEAQAAGHAGAGIGPPVGGAHGDEAVRTAAGET